MSVNGDIFEPVVDAAIIANLPEHADNSDGEIFTCEIDQIPKSLSRDDRSVKMMMRGCGLTIMREERRHFWRGIYVRREGKDNVEANAMLYRDTVQTCFGSQDLPSSEPSLPSNLDRSHTNAYCLSKEGRVSVARILCCVAYNNPDVQYCPMLYPITATIRHFLAEDDTYGLVCSLLSSKGVKFLPQSKLQHEVAWRAILELTRSMVKKNMSQIEEQSSTEEVEGLFQQWPWWIFEQLPLPHVARLMDSYLLEGIKILYRICFSLIRTFSKHLRSDSNWSGTIKQRGLHGAFIHFCKDIPIHPNSLVDRCFRVRNFSRATMDKVCLRIEMELKAKGFVPQHKKKSQSSDNLPSPQSLQEITAVSETMNYQKGMSTPQPKVKGSAVYPIQQLKSQILQKDELMTIWHWLPERMTMLQPTLAYSSNEHGVSLTTFYARTEPFEQTIIVVKATTGEIFGAYCSSSWAERKFKDDKGLRQTYFGTGESFLFKLGKENIRYPWVKLNSQNGSVGTKAEEHAKELFMSGSHEMITIGGGGGTGIYIDSSFTFGKTESCATFNNPPLCTDGDFQISVVEVYGLNRMDW